MLQGLIDRNYPIISPYSGVNAIRDLILRHKAAVVIDKETNDLFMGILTADDLIERPHNLVVDCVTPKPILEKNYLKKQALDIMVTHRVEVLPVFHEEQLEGIVFKDDIMKELDLERELLERILESGKRFLKDLLSNQSHYLRSPIANLIGLGEILKMAETMEDKQEAIRMMVLCANEADATLTQIQRTVDHQLSLYPND